MAERERWLVSKSNPGKPISIQDVEAEYGDDPRTAGMTPEQRFDWYKNELAKKGFDYEEKQPEPVLTRAAKNLIPSALNMVGGAIEGVGVALSEPKKTGLAIVGTLSGQDIPYQDSKTGEYTVMPGARMQQAFVEMMKKRYSNLGETFAEDPAGVLSDVSFFLAPALGVGSKAAQLGGMVRTASALQKAGDVANLLDATTAAAGLAGKAVGAPMRWAARTGYQFMLKPKEGLSAERLQAARNILGENWIAPSEKGEQQIWNTLKRHSDLRAQAAAQYDAAGNPGILIQEVINPPGGTGMDQLWDEAAAHFGKTVEKRQGYAQGARQFVEDATAGRGTIPEPGNYQAPSPGVFHVQLERPVPPIALTEADRARKAASRHEEIWKKAEQGKFEAATTASMAKDEAIKVLGDNMRKSMYAKLEAAGINPPPINGKQVTWEQLGKIDRAYGDALDIIENTMAKNVLYGGFLPGGVGPYYVASTVGAVTGLLKGDIFNGMTAAASVLAAVVMSKKFPDFTTKMLKTVDSMQMSPQAWRLTAHALRSLVSAPANVRRRLGPELAYAIDMAERKAEEGGAGQQPEPPKPITDPHPF